MTTIFTITVYHPMHKEINPGYTQFTGPALYYEIKEGEGILDIYEWETDREKGCATFARGSWAYVIQGESKEDSK